MSILMTILALGAVIFIHELGHLLAAKRAGVLVYEFAVGMGPKLLGTQIGETRYTLRALPFGGYVKLAGMDDNDEQPPKPSEDYRKKSYAQRANILAAGSNMNILLGFLIFIVIFSVNGVPKSTAIIEALIPDHPAIEAGLKEGDRIIAINQKPVENPEADIIPIVQNAANTTLLLDIDRAGEIMVLEIQPKPRSEMDQRGMIGVQFKSKLERQGPIAVLSSALKQTVFTITNVFASLKMLVSGAATVDDLAGPLGIVQLASFQYGKGLLMFFNWIAIISISLGIFNLFPFPVLDGGHLLFLGVEALRGKPLPEKAERWIATGAAAILISLMLLVLYNDILNWNSRTELFKALSGG